MANVTFKGEKLREARLARGYTITELASKIGVSKQSVSFYEKGQVEPKAEIIAKIAQELNVNLNFFEQHSAPQVSSAIWFRSMSSTTKKARQKAEIRLRWLVAIVNYLDQYVELPPINLPDIAFPSNIREISDDKIKFAAQELRKCWHLGYGPILNLVDSALNNGIIVSRHDLFTEKQDALSTWYKDSKPIVVLNSSKQSAVRSRFDLAHEIGHLILHRNVNSVVYEKRDTNKLMEEQAHLFAGELLLPETAIAQEWVNPTIRNFIQRKRRWKVSVAMQIMRTRQMKTEEEERIKGLWVQYSRAGFRKSEPLDDQLKMEQPGLLTNCFRVLLDNQVVTVNEIAENLQLPLSEIESLASMPEGFFNKYKRRTAFVPEIRPDYRKN